MSNLTVFKNQDFGDDKNDFNKQPAVLLFSRCVQTF